MKPLAIDLYAGVGGWTEGLLAEDFDVIGFDIERHQYGGHEYPAQLVLQDVRTLHGYQFRHASLIVASPPCQRYSYMAMPWTKAKELATWYRDPAHPERTVDLNTLFNACFRIQAEASEAAGRRIPMIVENVRGAQAWVGRSRWNFGSYHLWGDVPALMPTAIAVKVPGVDWHNYGQLGYQKPSFRDGAFKSSGMNWSDPEKRGQDFTRIAGRQRTEGVKVGGGWFGENSSPMRQGSSGSTTRKAASAMIAKIPLPLARHIGSVFRP